MPKYRVVDGHKSYNGKLYAPGDTMEIDEDQADQLRLEPLPNEEQDPASLTNKQLAELCVSKGIDVPAKVTKPQLLELLAAQEKE